MRPYVLSIAGFDPSGGAGVVADCKAFEALGCFGLSVITAVTSQHEKQVFDVNWLDLEQIKQQLNALVGFYDISAIKIGIVESVTMLEGIIDCLRSMNCQAPIVWDPVIKATAGTIFINSTEGLSFEKIDLITPNRDELLELAKEDNLDLALKKLSFRLPVYAKTVTCDGESLKNIYAFKSSLTEIKVDKLKGFSKHGSGCVHSSAITAGMANGLDTLSAISQAEKYMASYLKSSDSLLGVHGDYV